MSAFGAMRSGAEGHALPVLPTIVFHGTADTTVHPDNGEHVTGAALAAHKAAGVQLLKTQSTQSKSAEENTAEEKIERVRYSTADGRSTVENWRIDAGPHAWSGGSSAGSYTDPEGPSASAAMLTFFLQHRLQPV
jgi:poly(3-hydroxybutyrate) depolymerase